MATVYKRTWTYKGEQRQAWCVRYFDGGGKYRQETFEKKKDADVRLRAVELEMAEGTHVADADTVTFGFACDKWLRDCDRRRKVGDGMAGLTLENYTKNARLYVLPVLGNRKLTHLTPIGLQELVNDMSTRYAKGTVTAAAVVIRMTLKFSVERGWIKRNPLADRPLRVAGRRRREIAIPNKDEIRLILEALATRRHLENRKAYAARVVMVLLALFAGLRRGEVCGLQWANIDFAAGTLRIAHSYSEVDGLKTPKTRAGNRLLPMAAPVRAALEQLRDALGGEPSGYVLTSRNGTPLMPHHVTVAYWKPIMKSAGLLKPDGSPMYNFHSLRHAAASLFIEQGLQAFHLMKIIGHSSVQMTYDVYGHMFPEDGTARAAAKGISEQFDVPKVEHDFGPGGIRAKALERANRTQLSLTASKD